MPILQCYVDDKTLAGLRALSAVDGRSVETLAEDAIAEAVVRDSSTPRTTANE